MDKLDKMKLIEDEDTIRRNFYGTIVSLYVTSIRVSKINTYNNPNNPTIQGAVICEPFRGFNVEVDYQNFVQPIFVGTLLKLIIGGVSKREKVDNALSGHNKPSYDYRLDMPVYEYVLKAYPYFLNDDPEFERKWNDEFLNSYRTGKIINAKIVEIQKDTDSILYDVGCGYPPFEFSPIYRNFNIGDILPVIVKTVSISSKNHGGSSFVYGKVDGYRDETIAKVISEPAKVYNRAISCDLAKSEIDKCDNYIKQKQEEEKEKEKQEQEEKKQMVIREQKEKEEKAKREIEEQKEKEKQRKIDIIIAQEANMFICDTNIIIDFPELCDLIIEADRNICVPYPVLEELDGLKQSNEKNKGIKAQKALKVLNDHVGKIQFAESSPNNLPDGLDRHKNDNRILSIALERKSSDPVIITNDIGVIVKAKSKNIRVWECAKDL
jgi:rRNA-processing protein FCF1